MKRGWVGLAVALGVLPSVIAAQDTERLYQQACDEGEMIACNVFGLMYEHGEGVGRDLARAATLYARACEGGELVGCTNLGLLHEVGAGVPLDITRALGLYRVACEGGEELACASLGDVVSAMDDPRTGRFHKSGRVGDAVTGAPLSDAVVEVPNLGIRVFSDESGRIELAGLPSGRYALRTERAGYEILEGELAVPGTPDFVVLLNRDAVEDTLAPGRIVGRVLDEDGDQGLSGVEVVVPGAAGPRMLSDANGRFVLTGIEPGLVQVRFTRLGYAPRTATMVVQPGRTVEVSATMFTRPIELDAIEVTVRSAYLERSGFYERLGRSSGTHFTPEDLETIDPIEVADLVRRVPGIDLRRFSELDPNRLYAVSRRGASPSFGSCVLPVYLDGVRSPDPNINQVAPEHIAAIEMYNGITAPLQYAGNACGAVLIWTRR